MSFSAATKNEISKLPVDRDCCLIAELAAIVRMSGTIQISGMRKISLKFVTENASIARRIFVILKNLYNANMEILVRKNRQLKKNNNYMIVVKETHISRKILKDVGLITDNKESNFLIDHRIPEDIVKNRCCKRAYIRGAFLGGGSISNPEKSYHLEFVTNNEEHSKALTDLINSFGLNARIVTRKGNYVIYLKEGEQIVDVLNIIGAHQALLKFENIRVVKDVRNNVNRLVNCETANLNKTINASIKQVENIEFIDKTIGIEKLPENLQELARLRLEHRDASLKELGAMMTPPIGKSGVNYRFKKIEKIAKDLKRREKGGYDSEKSDNK